MVRVRAARDFGGEECCGLCAWCCWCLVEIASFSLPAGVAEFVSNRAAFEERRGVLCAARRVGVGTEFATRIIESSSLSQADLEKAGCLGLAEV